MSHAMPFITSESLITKGQLVALLQQWPDDMPVVLDDSQGPEFGPFISLSSIEELQAPDRFQFEDPASYALDIDDLIVRQFSQERAA